MAKAKDNEVVLVSPEGGEYTITSPASLYNLLARGYKLKGKETVAQAEQKVGADPAPAAPQRVATDAKPASK